MSDNGTVTQRDITTIDTDPHSEPGFLLNEKLRKDLDGILQMLEEGQGGIYDFSIRKVVHSKIKEAIMWAEQDLKEWMDPEEWKSFLGERCSCGRYAT